MRSLGMKDTNTWRGYLGLWDERRGIAEQGGASVEARECPAQGPWLLKPEMQVCVYCLQAWAHLSLFFYIICLDTPPLNEPSLIFTSLSYTLLLAISNGIFVFSVDLQFIKCVWELFRNLSRKWSREGCSKCQLTWLWVCRGALGAAGGVGTQAGTGRRARFFP